MIKLSNQAQAAKPRYTIEYLVLVLLLTTLPWHLGATPIEAWGLATILSLLVAARFGLHLTRGTLELSSALYKAKPVIFALLAWLAWNVIQVLPMPMSVIEWVAPLSAQIYQSAPKPSSFASISIDRYQSILHLFQGLLYFAIFLFSLLVLNSRKRIRYLLICLCISASAQAIFVMITTSENTETIKTLHTTLAHGSFVNHVQLASFMVLNIAILLGLLLSIAPKFNLSGWRSLTRYVLAQLLFGQGLVILASIALLAIALTMSQSRMGGISVLVSFMLTSLFYLLRSGKRRSLRRISSLITATITIAVISGLAWLNLNTIETRFSEFSDKTWALGTGEQNLARLEVYTLTLQLHQDAPWTGTGQGTFFSIFPAYQNADRLKFWQHAHNDYLEFLTDSGFIGLSLLGFSILYPLVQAIKAMGSRSRFSRGIAYSAGMMICSVLLFSLSDFTLRIPAIASLLMLALALAFIANSSSNTSLSLEQPR